MLRELVLFFLFFFLYSLLGQYLWPLREAAVLDWKEWGNTLLYFAVTALLARATAIAFRPTLRLPKGQRIVGVEEEKPPQVLEVIQPVVLERETQKPRLKKKYRSR
ncbi:MAG: hypothetical protein N2Z22_09910 [Turneriella sp.]|nr:hypothetical protein [Leptospiraceae bacterium]MCX7633632.1 hypothetical protein [Turneriella sp.]